MDTYEASSEVSALLISFPVNNVVPTNPPSVTRNGKEDVAKAVNRAMVGQRQARQVPSRSNLLFP
jgi:hypothetical protein